MKLVIQIPCLNERDHLPATLADLPRTLTGIDEIEVLVVDDGSTDDTCAVARAHGVHHLVRLPENRGLSRAYTTGVDAALRLGADVIVNTDADNQYRGADIAALVAPILEGRADLVVGDRRPGESPQFSWLKRWLQRVGTQVVNRVSGAPVGDSTSGFRAMNRRAAYALFVHNRFSYTLETLIQAGRAGLAVASVPVRTNPKVRESRLFQSIPDYLRRNGPVILRSYALYRPVQTFLGLAAPLAFLGVALVARFLWHYLREPSYSGYVQSLVLGIGALLASLLLCVAAMLSDLMAGNRRLLEETLARVRRLDADRARDEGEGVEGVESTGAVPWRPEGST